MSVFKEPVTKGDLILFLIIFIVARAVMEAIFS